MDNILLVVLTENNWLYAGLTALLPEMNCLRMNYSAHSMPREVMSASRVIIVVDSLIFFRGEWLALNSLRNSREDITVVWLTREHTGRIFPSTSRGDRILAQKQDIATLRLSISEILYLPEISVYRDSVRAVSLTLTERRLLPYFMAGVSLPLLSRRLGNSVKTLYIHRQSIMTKAGFRQPVFMEYLHQCNPALSWIFSPELSLWKKRWREE